MFNKFSKEILDNIKLGKEINMHHFFGAFIFTENNTAKTGFRTYAPNALSVNLLLDSKTISMKRPYKEVFEIIIDEDLTNARYQFEIETKDGKVKKSDPFARYTNLRPDFRNIVINKPFIKKEKNAKDSVPLFNKPIYIYEMHLFSWLKDGDNFLNYKKIADKLVPYLKENNFNYVEFMPVYEFPLDDSWGYQGTGFFSLNSRGGTIEDFKYLINELQKNDIKVLLDFAIGHINKDKHGLSLYDGTNMLTFDDDFKRENLNWGTENIDFSKGIASSFFLSCINFWATEFKIDGIRIDAVSNMLYYLGNRANGDNKEALEFLHNMHYFLKESFPNFLFSAEDSTAYYKVTHTPIDGGVGFNYKWDMGYMNDILNYYKKLPCDRLGRYDIPFGISYNKSENFILPFSHDEVVHGKNSLLYKMPGNYEEKFLNLKNFFLLTMTRPGKKMFFMGSEYAKFSEWNFKTELDFYLYEYSSHNNFNRYLKKLSTIYFNNSPLYEKDHEEDGLKWLVCNNDNALYIFNRYNLKNEYLTIIINTGSKTFNNFKFELDPETDYEIIFEIIESNKNMIKSNKYGIINIDILPLQGIILKKVG